MDYRLDGRLLKGFALIAWPAQYGVTGRSSFLINYRSELYAKDLGSDTGHSAPATVIFNPDRSWSRIDAFGDSE